MNLTKITGVFILALAFSGLKAQIRKYSNEFLQIGVGARALGMSGSSVASVNDVTSGYWNPAGLTQMQPKAQLGLMHSEYFAGIAKYDFGAFAMRPDSASALAISMVRFGVDEIPNTIELIDANGVVDYSRISSFSIADYAFMFSYARKLKIEGLSFGANAKIIRRVIGTFGNAWGFGLDAGIQYQKGNWHFGAMGRDISGTYNAWKYTLDDRTKEVFTQTGNEIPSSSTEVTPPKLVLGTGYKRTLIKELTLLAEINTDVTFDGMRNVLIRGNTISIDPKFGIELGYGNAVFLRGGIGNYQRIMDIKGTRINTIQPNFGVGIKFKAISLDYALTDIGDQSVALYSNVFSLKLDLNRLKSK